jgi:hypothetical protein
LEKAFRLAQILVLLGIDAREYIWRGGYHIIQLNTRNILKLAEHCPGAGTKTKPAAKRTHNKKVTRARGKSAPST